MSKKMRAVFSIVDYSKGDLIAEIYKKQNVPVKYKDLSEYIERMERRRAELAEKEQVEA